MSSFEDGGPVGVQPERIMAEVPEPSPEEILSRIARQEPAALAALYDRTASLVHGLALRILGDHGAAEDVTLEVYLQIWRQAGSYDRGRGSPLAWLLTVARTRAIDRLRSDRATRRGEPLRVARALPAPAPGPEDEAVRRERRGFVHQALLRLAPAQRRALELAYFGGLSQTEIAAQLGEPLGTVKTRIRLGLMHLREALAAAGMVTL
jgi:RNA polymerase sigma-70 factor (ECF subfamily)